MSAGKVPDVDSGKHQKGHITWPGFKHWICDFLSLNFPNVHKNHKAPKKIPMDLVEISDEYMTPDENPNIQMNSYVIP